MPCAIVRSGVAWSLTLLLALVSPRPLQGQQRPTSAQAAALLQSRPELAAQLRDRLINSGLSPEQVRARLRAEGYPESLLDAYLPSGSANQNPPTQSVFDAMRALGIVDTFDLQQWRPTPSSRPVSDPSMSRVGRAANADSTLSAESEELFGYAIFADASSRFEPNLDGPVDAGYRLGPGDELVLILTGDVEVAHTLNVTRGGFVVIPQVGQLGVANLTLGELEDLLYTRLGRVYGGVRRSADATTQFSVNVSRLRSNQVFVVGDVRRPGAFRISSAGTALSALYAAGGPTEQGSLRAVQVRRGGRTVSTLDVYDYLLRGDASQDIRLQQGDVLFVPVRGARVRVDGEVLRPATYEMKPEEELGDLLHAASGLKATATGRRVLVERILARGSRGAGAERTSIDVALGENGEMPAFPMLDGDLVRVPRIADRVRNRIVVQGHVWTPGPQGFTEGLTLEQALRRAGGMQPDAYLGRVLVSRLLPDSTRMQLRATLRDSTGATVEPMLLQPDDEITAFSRTAFRADEHVVIAGAVNKGGRFPYREGMTLRDLVLQAGGLSDLAELREAEIARRPVLADDNVLSTTLRVPLDSGYLFAEGRVPEPGAREVVLSPFDNVLIFRDPARRAEMSVQIHGEVRLPGTYTIRSRSERLTDLIERAGGFTAQGDTAAAYFSRLTTEGAFVSTLIRRAISTDTTDSLALSLTDTDATVRPDDALRIRVGVDVADAFRHRGRNENLLLQDGDSLFIPARRQTVSVRGEVNAPTQLVATGRSLGAYLNAAGGATPRGQASRAFVVQPNGKIESRRRLFWVLVLDPTPRPGATVVVPAQGEQRTTSRLETLSIVSQAMAALATVVLVTRR